MASIYNQIIENLIFSNDYKDDAEDPACVPMLWISKWVDYSDKYGLGYQLCDESVGVLFNDSTRLILCSSGEYVLTLTKLGGNSF